MSQISLLFYPLGKITSGKWLYSWKATISVAELAKKWHLFVEYQPGISLDIWLDSKKNKRKIFAFAGNALKDRPAESCYVSSCPKGASVSKKALIEFALVQYIRFGVFCMGDLTIYNGKYIPTYNVKQISGTLLRYLAYCEISYKDKGRRVVFETDKHETCFLKTVLQSGIRPMSAQNGLGEGSLP